MNIKSRCQRCDFEKKNAGCVGGCESGYNNEKCPQCGAFLLAVPVIINGNYF